MEPRFKTAPKNASIPPHQQASKPYSNLSQTPESADPWEWEDFPSGDVLPL